MGQKTHPTGFRIGITKDWKSLWYADDSSYADTALEDHKIREIIEEDLGSAGIDDIIIERSLKAVSIEIIVARPGVAIGRGGSNIEAVRKKLKKLVSSKLKVDIKELEKPMLSADVVAADIARRIERRTSVGRAMNWMAQKVMDAGAEGVKIKCSGVLSGASSISRSVQVLKGSVPTSTLRADLDYALDVAKTGYGTIGVKVWINRGGTKV